MTRATPNWLNRAERPSWQTKVVTDVAMHYCVAIPADWEPSEERTQTPYETWQSFQGTSRADWLMVSFMTQADPKAAISNWVEAMLRFSGFPSVLPTSHSLLPTLLTWEDYGTCPLLSERLRVDETHLYQGIATFSSPPSDLSRLYILLARRGVHAWKITLSLLTAYPPGSSEELIQMNDHIRAGATFGTIQLL